MLLGKAWPVFSLLPSHSQHPALLYWYIPAYGFRELPTSASPSGAAAASFELSIPYAQIIFPLEALLCFNRVIYIEDCLFSYPLRSVRSFLSCLPLVQHLITQTT